MWMDRWWIVDGDIYQVSLLIFVGSFILEIDLVFVRDIPHLFNWRFYRHFGLCFEK